MHSSGKLLRPRCGSYHIYCRPAPSPVHSSPEWEQPGGVFGRPRILTRRRGSENAPDWWTSSEPWCRFSPASPCAVWGSSDYSFLSEPPEKIQLAIPQWTQTARHNRKCDRVATDLWCLQVWPQPPAPPWCASPLCWRGCECDAPWLSLRSHIWGWQMSPSSCCRTEHFLQKTQNLAVNQRFHRLFFFSQ